MTRTGLARDLFSFRHVTIPAAEGDVHDAARAAFADLASQLRRGAAAPLQEKVYGPCAARQAVLGIRREVFARAGVDPASPCTYIAGRPDEDLGFAGVQVWAVAARAGAPVTVRTVRSGDGVAGRLLESPGVRLLHLFAVDGQPEDMGLPQGVADQARRMFETADRALVEHGFAFAHVARTWIYLARLLDWYGELNRVRAAFLRDRGITDDARFPASTGIQGTGGLGECMMDVLAVAGDDARVDTIRDSSRQRRPMRYGSSFSRGLRMGCGDRDTVFVSGTASIDAAGQTLHCWQREAQILETLLGVAALLEDQGAGLADVRLATLFCKDRETLDVYHRVVRQLGITALPVIPVLADVCRPELMVEIEALAEIPARTEGGS